MAPQTKALTTSTPELTPSDILFKKKFQIGFVDRGYDMVFPTNNTPPPTSIIHMTEQTLGYNLALIVKSSASNYIISSST